MAYRTIIKMDDGEEFVVKFDSDTNLYKVFFGVRELGSFDKKAVTLLQKGFEELKWQIESQYLNYLE